MFKFFKNKKQQSKKLESMQPENSSGARTLADVAEGYRARNDITALLICGYNLETDGARRFKRLIDIMDHLQNCSVWVPFSMNYSERDMEKFLNAKAGDTIQTEDDIRMRPDLLKNNSGKLFFPAFSAKEEAPEDYAVNFSWINMPFTQCCEIAKNHPQCEDIIINAFSVSMQITDALINIILNRAKQETSSKTADIEFPKSDLITEEQFKIVRADANGGLRFPLDNDSLFFLTVYHQDGAVLKYSIDVEKASDSHYEISTDGADELAKLLEKQCAKGSFLENLREYFRENGESDLCELLTENSIHFGQFHYDDY